MSIGAGLTLVTGATGSGKTALVVSWLAGLGDRPLFCMGIPELVIDHQECPPVDEWTELRSDPADLSLRLPYFRFPAGAVLVLDEAQRVFRPRPVGSKVPDVIAAFETRRHTGLDVVLITQHPQLLDSNVRRLVTRHVHVHCTVYGRYLLEWVGVGVPDDASSRKLAVRQRYRLPKLAFGLYKSAELHTKLKARPGWALPVLVGVSLLVAGGSWLVVGRFQDRGSAQKKVESAVASEDKKPLGVDRVVEKRGALAADDLVAEYRPRIEGLQHTAPAYDALTVPVAVPRPAGCIRSAKSCRCYDQRGSVYETTDSLCRQFVNSAPFLAFVPDDSARERSTAAKPPAVDQGEKVPASVALSAPS